MIRVLERRALRRLWEFAITKRRHLAADLDKDSLDAAVAAPVGEDGQLGRVDCAVILRDEGEVDAGDELDRRW